MPTANHEVVTRVLGYTWDTLQRIVPDLPNVSIVVGTDAALSHVPDLRGRTQILIYQDTLDYGPQATLSALAHDAAHLLAEERGLKDYSDEGRWHNQKFAGLAAELGFDYRVPEGGLRSSREGAADLFPAEEWMHQRARPGNPTKLDLRVALRRLRKYLPEDSPQPPIPFCYARRKMRASDNPVSASCLCAPARTVTVRPSVWAQGPIMCGVCGCLFDDRG